MKKPTSSVLSKRLTQYSALTAAIAGITDGHSQSIVHVDLATTTGYLIGGIDSGTPSHWIDLDGNSLNDFYFQGLGSVNNPLAIVKADPGSNYLLGNNYYYPFALNNSAVISAGQAAWNNAFTYLGILNNNSCFNASHWCDVTDKYLGVRFKIGVGTHYGWVKLDVNASGSSFTIKEYAYVGTPGIGLTAGQTTLGIDDQTISNTKIIALRKSIGLYNLPEATNYRIYDMMGKAILDGSTRQSNHVIEASTLASGVYIVELSDKESNATFRKKVVLQ